VPFFKGTQEDNAGLIIKEKRVINNISSFPMV
jgi:hypothetical protein